MDPLSDVLALLKPSSVMSGGFDKGGDWSVRFGPHEGIKFQAIISGEVWLAVEGVPEPVLMRAGDCFLLPRGLPFQLASDLSLTPMDAAAFLKLPVNGGTRVVNGGGQGLSLGAHFTFKGSNAEILLSMLPPIVHLKNESDKAAMRWSLERLMLEVREPQPGGALVVEQLAYMMLVQALRLYLMQGAESGVGWLFALADRQIGVAINAMHEDAAHRWTIQTLAEQAGMSRSTFALKFKQAVGVSPMDYLTRWRMMVAADRLMNTRESILTVAQALGYDSESAFSTAFKRVMGCAPRQYSRGQKATLVPIGVFGSSHTNSAFVASSGLRDMSPR
jgi:AraC-like DNA-binding protein